MSDYNSEVRFRERPTIKTQIESLIKDGTLGVATASEFYRLINRMVISNPSLLVSSKEDLTLQDVINTIANLEKLIEFKFKEISLVLNAALDTNDKSDTMAILFEEMIDELLSIQDVFQTQTISELENYYPAKFWEEYTEYILERLKGDGLIRVIGDDKIIWLMK